MIGVLDFIDELKFINFEVKMFLIGGYVLVLF